MKFDASMYKKIVPLREMENGDCFFFDGHIAMKIQSYYFENDCDEYYYTAIDLETTRLLELDDNNSYEVIIGATMMRE